MASHYPTPRCIHEAEKRILAYIPVGKKAEVHGLLKALANTVKETCNEKSTLSEPSVHCT